MKHILLFLSFFNCFAVMAQQPQLGVPIGHTAGIARAAFSRDGARIVTAGWDQTALIWDAASGKILRRLLAHTGSVSAACFSPDGSRIVTASRDGTAIIWEANTGTILYRLSAHDGAVETAQFSPDGTRIVTAGADGTAIIWETATGKLLHQLEGHSNLVNTAQFSPDGSRLVTASDDNDAVIWETATGKLLHRLKGHSYWVLSATFSADGSRILTASADKTAIIWDARSGAKLITCKQEQEVLVARFSTDGSRIATAGEAGTVFLWDASSGKLLHRLPGHQSSVRSASFNPNGTTLITAGSDGTVITWNTETGRQLHKLTGHTDVVADVQVSPDGSLLLSSGADKTAIVWNLASGRLLHRLQGFTRNVYAAAFNPEGTQMVTVATLDETAVLWDVTTGKFLRRLSGHQHWIHSARFSPDGKQLVTTSEDKTAIVWDVATGKLLHRLTGHQLIVKDAQFSSNGSLIVTAGWDRTAIVWNARTGRKLLELAGHDDAVSTALFSPDGKIIITTSQDHSAILWETATGKQLHRLVGHTDRIITASFRGDGAQVVTAGYDSTVLVWDVKSGTLLDRLTGYNAPVHVAQYSPDGNTLITADPSGFIILRDAATGLKLQEQKTGPNVFIHDVNFNLNAWLLSRNSEILLMNSRTNSLYYRFIPVDSSDYLVTDSLGRFDGTLPARKQLYFVCGDEVIDLDQVKDQLWVPGLAERIMKGETINAPGLGEVDVCNRIPLVAALPVTNTAYSFRITPQRGGLGEVLLFVNGMEVQRYRSTQLVQQQQHYLLQVPAAFIRSFFRTGETNHVTVKALTADNTIASRGSEVEEAPTTTVAATPNVFAVFIGVSDYKSSDLKLSYAAKDAEDMANAFLLAASKLLNKNNEEHVFVYRLHTGTGRTGYPDKNTIRLTLEEIGKKAKPNDIFLFFFAGHGVMQGADKRFYFLTADASKTLVNEAIDKAGISTEELTEWINPRKMKAGKRVLIFDACNSGQVIREMVTLTGGSNHMVARNDELGQQQKTIEKLSDRSGFFILSASASNQYAYEFSRYAQGLLTHALLRTIKLNPAILEQGRFLDLSRWLQASKELVTELVKENNARQEPQLVSSNNFVVGIVDEEVRSNIVLPEQKPVFAKSEFRNSELKVDNLRLRKQVDKALGNVAARGVDNPIIFEEFFTGSGAYTITGDYTINGDEIRIVVVLVKDETEVVGTFSLTGKLAELENVSIQIVERVKKLIGKTG